MLDQSLNRCVFFPVLLRRREFYQPFYMYDFFSNYSHFFIKWKNIFFVPVIREHSFDTNMSLFFKTFFFHQLKVDRLKYIFNNRIIKSHVSEHCYVPYKLLFNVYFYTKKLNTIFRQLTQLRLP